MKNILEQFYYGDLCPISDGAPASAGYRQEAAKYGEASRAFRRQLRERLPELEQDFVSLETDIQHLRAMEAKSAFQHGWSLGAAMLIETLS